jgi:hypothetical protein
MKNLSEHEQLLQPDSVISDKLDECGQEDLCIFIMQQYLQLGERLAEVFQSQGFKEQADKVMEAYQVMDAQVKKID